VAQLRAPRHAATRRLAALRSRLDEGRGREARVLHAVAVRKARNLDRDPHVAISITDEENPCRTAWIRGRVVDRIEGEHALEIIDRLSNQYTGEDSPMRTGVVHVIEPERVGHYVLPFTH